MDIIFFILYDKIFIFDKRVLVFCFYEIDILNVKERINNVYNRS